MSNPSNYNKIAYQSFDLKSTSMSSYEINNFINKNYNLIEGYFFDFEIGANPQPFWVEEFKIDDLEILPRGFLVDNLAKGKKMPFNDKFTKLNIPIRQGKFSLSVRQLGSTTSRFTIIFKLKNVSDDSIYNKDFFRYETHYFTIDTGSYLLDNVIKKTIRSKSNMSFIKGISVELLPRPSSSNSLKRHQLGNFKMSINSKKSNPINIPIFYNSLDKVNYEKQFVELNEPVEGSSTIDIVFENHLGTILNRIGSFPDLQFCLTIKSI